jgi:small subunit ribosomal protein S17e
VDRIKRLSIEVLERYKDKFGINFEENKKSLDKISIIRSKGLKNEIAGFITKFLKHEMLDKKKQEERMAMQDQINEEYQEENLDMEEPTIKSDSQAQISLIEEKPQEISESSQN